MALMLRALLVAVIVLAVLGGGLAASASQQHAPTPRKHYQMSQRDRDCAADISLCTVDDPGYDPSQEPAGPVQLGP